uniref:PDZ domain-containing protein n=1 Tax=Ciona savignyi TaxID=51511 RepID=H2Z6G9_CIOSA
MWICGAANVCQLCIGDEILAINDVTLSSTLSQDEIVQLIVDSVITGNLGLDIRRYGKSKKQTGNPLRLSGTKVVMTPGGFVQVRSDKGLLVSTKPSTNNHTKHNQEQPTEHKVEPKQTKPTTKLLPANNQDTPRSPKFQRPVGSRAQEAAPQRSNQISLDHPKPNPSTDAHAPQRFTGKPAMEHRNTLQDQLMEESQRLAEREAKLLQDKRKRIAEAKLEEARLEEELLKIENSKLEQQRKREEEKQRLVGDQNLGLPINTASYQQHGLSHWLIEEAERSRIAQQEGKSRSNPLQQNYKQSGSVLSDRLVERQTNPSVHASHYNHPPTSLNHIWNDPSAQATLL